jgi:hypothetical protein
VKQSPAKNPKTTPRKLKFAPPESHVLLVEHVEETENTEPAGAQPDTPAAVSTSVTAEDHHITWLTTAIESAPELYAFGNSNVEEANVRR